MDTAGANLVNLTNDLGFDGSPAWSSDGTNLAFQSNRTGNMQIYVLSLADSSVSNLTNQTTFEHMEPTWSPDNTSIAFASNRDGNHDIYMMSATDGSGVVNLTNQTTGDNHNPTWSPDGSKIAFETTRNGTSEIYVMNVDGSAQQNLTNHPKNDWHPAWSPDGSHIIFTSDRDGKFEIYKMDATDGTGQTNLSNRPDSYEWKPSYSPDGTKIVFSTDRDRNSDDGKNDEIYVMNASDGSAQTNLTNHPASDEYAVWSSAQPTPVQPTPVQPTPVQPTNTSIPESPDFATLKLRDAWDMSEFSDISRDLNGFSTTYVLQDIQHSDGIFSARTVPERENDGYFALLHPGLNPATLNIPGDGALNPIPSTYRCLYAAMKIESGPARPNRPEVLRAIWFADSRMAQGISGFAAAAVHSEPDAWTSGVQPAINWKLYRIQLDASPLQGGGTGWSQRESWQGLQINPINRGDTRFSVDWARLTTCTPQTTRISWSPDPNVQAIWIRPSGTDRAIRVAPTTDVFPIRPLDGSSGAYDLDTQGLPPGTYQVGVSTLTEPPHVWNDTLLKINTTPVAQFVVPSAFSGEDYATTQGNPWNFDNPVDTPLLRSQAVPGAASFEYLPEGMLKMTSPSGPQPAGIDTQVYLNTTFEQTSAIPIDAREYRYLSFRIKNEWVSRNFGPTPWANGGMLVRWNWSVPSVSGQSGFLCNYGGDDIPMDIGWHIYTVDLHDVRGGMPDGAPLDGVEHCGTNAGTIPWETHPQVMSVRFDPNENISKIDDPYTGGGTFIQTLDWVRLTKDNQVNRGEPFQIQISLNKPPDAVQQKIFYYTTDPANPHQNRAVPASQITQVGPEKVYLPLVIRAGSQTPSVSDENLAQFTWDTSNVNPGTYFLCVDLSDSINTGTYCSSAPVIVR
jgi:hypothetical protein